MALPIVQISGHSMKIESPLKKYINEKLYKHEKIFDLATSVDVECERNVSTRGVDQDYRFEVTMFLPNATVRVEKVGPDLFPLIDEATDVMARKVKQYRERLRDWESGEHRKAGAEIASGSDTADAAPIVDYVPKISERRRMENCTPMTEQEAVEQMELLDRDCYLFKSKTTGEFAMVYRKRDGGYGLVEPCD